MGYGTRQHIERIQEFVYPPFTAGHFAKNYLRRVQIAEENNFQIWGDTNEPEGAWQVGRRNGNPVSHT